MTRTFPSFLTSSCRNDFVTIFDSGRAITFVRSEVGASGLAGTSSNDKDRGLTNISGSIETVIAPGSWLT